MPANCKKNSAGASPVLVCPAVAGKNATMADSLARPRGAFPHVRLVSDRQVITDGQIIDLEVSNLAPEVVLVGEPVRAVASWNIRVCVNDSHALEA